MRPKKKLFFITDQKKVDGLKVVARLPRGSFVILRDYENPEREKLGREIKKICRNRGLKLLVGKDPKLAIKLKADGVHFPEKLAGNLGKWRVLMPQFIYSVAAHHEKVIRRHEADYYLVSPAFKTSSHLGQKPKGQHFLRKMAKITPKTVILGGVNPKNVKTLRNGGFAGVAAISGLKDCGYNATEWAVSVNLL